MLHRLIGRADVVITSSRPRALDQLGLDVGRAGTGPPAPGLADDLGLRPRPPMAPAGGLRRRRRGGRWPGGLGRTRAPCFCGDAVADPLTGLASTAARAPGPRSRWSWVIDASMADIAGGMAGPAFPVGDRRRCSGPRGSDGGSPVGAGTPPGGRHRHVPCRRSPGSAPVRWAPRRGIRTLNPRPGYAVRPRHSGQSV